MAANVLDYIARNADSAPTADRQFEVFGVYVSAETWTAAQSMLLDDFTKTRSVGFVRVYAKDIIRTLRRNPALIKCAGVLRERAEQTAGLEVHGNADPRPRTLFHSSGASATGTRRELMTLTGLSYDRVRDLITQRRRYALGWSAVAAEAKKGPGAPGRPRKAPAPPPATEAPEPEFFGETGTQFF